MQRHIFLVAAAMITLSILSEYKIPLRISNNSPEVVKVTQLTHPQDKIKENGKTISIDSGKQVDMVTQWTSKKAALTGLMIESPTKTYFAMFNNDAKVGVSDDAHEITILQAGKRDVRDTNGSLTTIPLLGVYLKKGKKSVTIAGILSEKNNVILLV